MKRSPYGFTIVELLIVIVVVAILAAISIVAYSGIQNRGYDSTIMADLRSFAQSMKIYEVENGHPLRGPAGHPVAQELTELKWKASRSAYDTSHELNLAFCHNYSPSATHSNWGTPSGSRNNWALIVLSKSGKVVYVTDSVGPTEYTGTAVFSFDNAPTVCATAISEIDPAGYVNVFHGYSAIDSTSGPWRQWTGS